MQLASNPKAITTHRQGAEGAGEHGLLGGLEGQQQGDEECLVAQLGEEDQEETLDQALADGVVANHTWAQRDLGRSDYLISTKGPGQHLPGMLISGILEARAGAAAVRAANARAVGSSTEWDLAGRSCSGSSKRPLWQEVRYRRQIAETAAGIHAQEQLKGPWALQETPRPFDRGERYNEQAFPAHLEESVREIRARRVILDPLNPCGRTPSGKSGYPKRARGNPDDGPNCPVRPNQPSDPGHLILGPLDTSFLHRFHLQLPCHFRPFGKVGGARSPDNFADRLRYQEKPIQPMRNRINDPRFLLIFFDWCGL